MRQIAAQLGQPHGSARRSACSPESHPQPARRSDRVRTHYQRHQSASTDTCLKHIRARVYTIRLVVKSSHNRCYSPGDDRLRDNVERSASSTRARTSFADQVRRRRAERKNWVLTPAPSMGPADKHLHWQNRQYRYISGASQQSTSAHSLRLIGCRQLSASASRDRPTT